MSGAVLAVLDDDGGEVRLDRDDAAALLAVTDGLEAATVSACPTCRSRILAAVALVDLLGAGAPFVGAGALVDLADDAPTLHLYVLDLASSCRHVHWRDPGFEEWLEATDDLTSRSPRH